MKIDDVTINKIAGLAYLEFGEDEKEKIRHDLEEILSFIGKLNELDTEKVEPLIYLSENRNVLREDRVKTSISTSEALKNAPDRDEQFFRVPKVINK